MACHLLYIFAFFCKILQPLPRHTDEQQQLRNTNVSDFSNTIFSMFLVNNFSVLAMSSMFVNCLSKIFLTVSSHLSKSVNYESILSQEVFSFTSCLTVWFCMTYIVDVHNVFFSNQNIFQFLLDNLIVDRFQTLYNMWELRGNT